jgi:hypothetical protein
MTTAKLTSIQEHSWSYSIVMQDLMERGVLQLWGGDGLSTIMVKQGVCCHTVALPFTLKIYIYLKSKEEL